MIPERRSATVTPATCKASAGAVEHLAVARVRNLADWLGTAKAAGAWVYGADSDAPVAYDAPDYARPRRAGAGLRGARPEAARALPPATRWWPFRCAGKVGSLNVSTAAAALVYAILHLRART